MRTEFRKKLEQLINAESMEAGSDTPDFILARFLCDVLEAFDFTQQEREEWYGRSREKLQDCDIPLTPYGRQQQEEWAMKISILVNQNSWFFKDCKIGSSCLEVAYYELAELIAEAREKGVK